MTNPAEEPGTEEMAEEPLEQGYGNDTGFAEEAAEADDDGTDAASGAEPPKV
ncbi:hypothetical protein [Kineococcus rhizosphaerae]|uniref:Uncharacterized protein n=1 Tax=Kineococcus rhizosphaerae TaxID=559628 RepID=A0A2T0R3G8_9ACTN|nr:hypothetical protein [Kineococcus rhizosphaerae]PRY14543.1 hypothetical protein CLV37_106101 [Kineococcus rhizosphaerae]